MCFFLCWLVDMVYSVLNLLILGKGWCDFPVDLLNWRKKYFFSYSKNCIWLCFYLVDLLIWHILSGISESGEKGWCNFAVDMLNWRRNICSATQKLFIGVFCLCWILIWHILLRISEFWENGWCDFPVDMLNWQINLFSAT